MKFDYIEATIGSHFLPALINGDLSGISARDQNDLAAWELDILIQAQETGNGAGHWSTGYGRDEFGVCDVTGFRGDVEIVRYMYPID